MEELKRVDRCDRYLLILLNQYAYYKCNVLFRKFSSVKCFCLGEASIKWGEVRQRP